MTQQPETSPGTVPRWTLGWRLQRSLAHAGMSVQEMAFELEVSRGTVSRWMADRGADPRAGYLHHWALRTGVSYEWLCHGDTRPCDYRPRSLNLAAKSQVSGPPGTPATRHNNMHYCKETQVNPAA